MYIYLFTVRGIEHEKYIQKSICIVVRGSLVEYPRTSKDRAIAKIKADWREVHGIEFVNWFYVPDADII